MNSLENQATELSSLKSKAIHGLKDYFLNKVVPALFVWMGITLGVIACKRLSDVGPTLHGFSGIESLLYFVAGAAGATLMLFLLKLTLTKANERARLVVLAQAIRGEAESASAHFLSAVALYSLVEGSLHGAIVFVVLMALFILGFCFFIASPKPQQPTEESCTPQ